MKGKVVIAAMMLLIVVLACGKEESKKVYSTPEGKVEVTQKQEGEGHEMTITTEEGETTVRTGIESIPKDLGVPIYPGVEKKEGGTWSVTGEDEKGDGAFSSSILFSEDSIEKVSAFYKEKLQGSDPQIFEMAMPQGKMVNISVDMGETSTSIVLTESKDDDKQGTNIQITKLSK